MNCNTTHYRANSSSVPGDPTAAINDGLLVIVMLETENAIAKAEEIAAVPGVDVLMIGCGDLTASLGLQGQFEHERIMRAFDTVLAACAKHKKWPGMGGVGTESAMANYIKRGIRFVLSGNDLGLLAAAATQRAKALRGKE